MTQTLINCDLVLPDQILCDGAVIIDAQGKLSFVGRRADLPLAYENPLDLSGRLLAPGFIDIHVHGGNGITFGEGDLAATTAAYSAFAAAHGVVGYLMSVAEETADALAARMEEYVRIYTNPPAGAEPLGFHLEGPYLNPERKGAFNNRWLRTPNLPEIERYIDAAQGWIRQLTLAPELPNAREVAQRLRQEGVVAAMGHTDLKFEEAAQALARDYQHVTHAFNAMRGFNHREPGVVGALLLSENVTAELIADTIHVHPAAMRLLIRCLGSDRVIAITDAMSAAGLPDGEYQLLGNAVHVQAGKATLADGTIAGSAVTMERCVANLHEQVGLTIYEAIKLASLNPARRIGVDERLGSLSVGKDASVVVLDEDMQVLLTLVKGQLAFDAGMLGA